jgi:hypothetical protein
MKEEEFLLPPNPPVISFRSFLQEVEMLLQLLFVRERNTVYALKRVVLSVAKEIAGRILHDLEGCNAAGMGNMRTSAQIY